MDFSSFLSLSETHNATCSTLVHFKQLLAQYGKSSAAMAFKS